MEGTKAITVRLAAGDYERLSAEAARLGMRTGTLVRAYLRAGMSAPVESEVERRRRVGLAALDRLTALTADLPLIDAVKVARDSRRELEERAAP